jgi:hypothetical protein
LSIERSKLYVLRSTFYVLGSTFSVLRSAFDVPRTALDIQNVERFKNVEPRTSNAERQNEERLLYQSMAISRRTLLKGFAATGVGAVTGAGAYGYLHGRSALELTRATLPVDHLPPGLAGLRIGFMTDIHRSRWVSAEDVSDAVRLLMAEAPDLIVIGGDYVTWGDRQYVGASAEALGGLQRTARGVRHSGKPRRRP